MSANDKANWLQQAQDARSCYEPPDDPVIRQLRSQQAYMNNYLITNGGFTFPEHVQPFAIQYNPISTDYLVESMSSYLATPGSLSATSAAANLVASEILALVPNDNPLIVDAPVSKRQWTLDDCGSQSTSAAVAPAAVETVTPVPPAGDDPTVVYAHPSKQQRTLDHFFFPTASVAAVPDAVTIVAPDPLADSDLIVVSPPSPKQRKTLRNFWSST